MDRESMIDLLLRDSLERLNKAPLGRWSQSLLRDGFTGFANMSNTQLAQEAAARGFVVGEIPETEWPLPDADPDLLLALAAAAGDGSFGTAGTA
jgi:hypothetical protein